MGRDTTTGRGNGGGVTYCVLPMVERNLRPTIDGAPRRATSIRLDTALLAQAKAADLNPAEVLEGELIRLLKAKAEVERKAAQAAARAKAGKGFKRKK